MIRRWSALVVAAIAPMLVACGSDPPPNVVIIVLDTMRADRCSVHGYGRPTTPELERFAADAVTFDDAWSPAFWTKPSHASLLTGLAPRNHGLMAGVRPYLETGVDTLAEHLRRAGYATGAFVNNPFLSTDSGLLQGFDEQQLLHEERERPYELLPTAPETHTRALRWVESRDNDEPFFLLLNHMEPHGPYTPSGPGATALLGQPPPARDLAWSETFFFPRVVHHNFGDRPLSDLSLAKLSNLYDAEIATLDYEMGRFFDILETRGLLENTIVVITSDHGEAFNEHGLVDHMMSLHRELLHVPLIVRAPTHLRGGGRVTTPVSLTDVAGTILELCDLPVPSDLDGRSLLRPAPDRIVYAESGAPVWLMRSIRRVVPLADLSRWDRTIQSAYDGRHHFIEYSDETQELYDVLADPLEQEDLAATKPEIRERLRQYLAER